MTRTFLTILILTILALPTISCSKKENSKETIKSLDNSKEMIKSFKVNGKLIDPKLIELFNTSPLKSTDLPDLLWSEKNPRIVSVDITTLEWDETIKTFSDGSVGYEMKGEYGELIYFKYLYVGQLKNGVHVIHKWNSGGGSGVFHDLMFFILYKENRYSTDLKGRERIVLEYVDSMGLGDRTKSEINVSGNDVLLKTKDFYTKEVSCNRILFKDFNINVESFECSK